MPQQCTIFVESYLNIESRAPVEHPWTEEPFTVAARRLMDEKGLTLRRLAETAGVDKGFLSRALRGREKASVDLILRVSVALDLPPYYFPEARKAWLHDFIDKSPGAADQLYNAINTTRQLTPEELSRLQELADLRDRKHGGRPASRPL